MKNDKIIYCSRAPPRVPYPVLNSLNATKPLNFNLKRGLYNYQQNTFATEIHVEKAKSVQESKRQIRELVSQNKPKEELNANTYIEEIHTDFKQHFGNTTNIAELLSYKQCKFRRRKQAKLALDANLGKE